MSLLGMVDPRIAMLAFAVVIAVVIQRLMRRSEIRQWREFIPAFFENRSVRETAEANPVVMDDMIYHLKSLCEKDRIAALASLSSENRESLLQLIVVCGLTNSSPNSR